MFIVTSILDIHASNLNFVERFPHSFEDCGRAQVNSPVLPKSPFFKKNAGNRGKFFGGRDRFFGGRDRGFPKWQIARKMIGRMIGFF
jgi:hypothetical protein